MNLRTITLQIGNSDDKLSQNAWAIYCTEVGHAVDLAASHVHFHGHAPGGAAWQNACWVFEVESTAVHRLQDMLIVVRRRFGQDSIAWMEGVTAFL